MEIKYPEITVRLIGLDGNAWAILGRVRKALYKAGVSEDELNQFMANATAHDYNHLLQTVTRWVNVE